MFEAYRIGISLALSGNTTSALGMLQRQLLVTGGNVKEVQKHMEALRLTAMKAGVQMAGAFAIAKPMEVAAVAAAKLQKQMIAIQVATQGSTADLNNMRGVIEDMAGKTMFSATDVAGMAKIMATSTGWDRQQISRDLPAIAQFADAQKILKGTAPEESTKTAIGLSHLAGLSTPDEIKPFLDTLTKASLVIPGSLNELANSLKYSMTSLRTLGINDQQSILLNATMNRMGLSGTRGGTMLSAALTRSIPGILGSGLLKGKSQTALKHMGMVDESGHSTVFTDGKFDTLKFLKALSDYEGREYAQKPEAIARQDILKDVHDAFGVNGARGMEVLATSAARTALEYVQKTLSEGAGTSVVQQTFADNSVYQQAENAQTNMNTLMSELGYKLLPAVSQGLQVFNGEITKMIAYVRDPKNNGVVTSGLIGAGGLSAFLAGGAISNGVKWVLKGYGFGARGATAATTAGEVAAAGTGGSALGLGAIGAGALGIGAAAGTLGVFEAAQQMMINRLAAWIKGPPTSKQDTNINIRVDLDGQKVGQAVTKYQANRLNGPFNSGSTFDPRMSMTPAGTGAW